MTNLEKYNAAFVAALELNEADLDENCTVQNVEKWDSIGHLALVNALEDTFEIMFDPDDIIAFRSYEDGKKLLTRYGVEL